MQTVDEVLEALDAIIERALETGVRRVIEALNRLEQPNLEVVEARVREERASTE